uniref:Uncharacterized protein n=1 Tax=Meloidogyne javanica TaxID=6303 RepID=A0A915M428_MELJA
MLLLLYVSFLTITQTEAIRGALFRTGRSADEEISPQLVGIANNAFNPNNLPGNCPEDEEEEQFLSMASHPALMVDLRQLLKFSRERALAGEVQHNINSKFTNEVKNTQQYKSKRMSNARRANAPWKSPRLAAYIALLRNSYKNNYPGSL